MALFDKMFNFSKGKKDKDKLSKEELKNKQSVQSAIPYERIFKDGTIETKPGTYTRAYNLGEVNFKIAPKEDKVSIFRAFGDFLNTFSPEVRFQTIIQNSVADRRTSLENIRYILRPGDELNKFRQEMNGVMLDKMSEGGHGLKQDKFLVVSIKDENLEHAFTVLNNIENEIQKGLRKISRDVEIRRQSIEQRLEQLFNIYNQDGESVFYNDFKEVNGVQVPCFNYDKLLKQGLTSKDMVAPSGMAFNANHSIIGNTYSRSMYLERVPTWLSTDFISELQIFRRAC